VLALACVSSWQVARTSDDDVVGDVAQPARARDSISRTIQIIGRVVAEGRGSIVGSLRPGRAF
jgi:hypothetical protein